MSIYIEWLVLVLLSWVFDLLGLLVLPLAIAFSDGKTLPAWAWPWGNDREPLGDAARRADIDAATGFVRGWLRFRWLALRNPGNNFGYALGFEQSGARYSYSGDPETSDQGHEGVLHVTGDNVRQRAFCIYIVKRWGTTRCLRIMLGWKIHDMINDGTKAQLVCVVNPLMTFEERAAA